MKVSVCIPTYNHASFLEMAIRSAMQQTFLPSEIIVSDDCSTDKTFEVCERLLKEIPLLKYYRQPVNLGITRNVDFCLRSAEGDFIIRLDSDDCLLPNYTEELIKLLKKFPDAGYAHAAVQEIDENGQFVKDRRLFRKAQFQSSDNALKASIKGYRVAANIIMFRRAALEKVNFISSKTNFAEDYHLSASLAAAGFGNVYSGEALSFYRVWSDNGKVRQRRKLEEITGIRKVFEEVIEPAYEIRGWKLKNIKRSKINFACNHANCLGWNIYNLNEKKELAAELNKLSSTPRAKFYSWLYLNGMGIVATKFSVLKSIPKSIIKRNMLMLMPAAIKDKI